ncbi:MAG: helix-turn-helix domain-containing protein [Clostridia bacterium]|nr:helix-turn-helix domain-containing protein [Clostridia bacterium]
MLDIKKRADLKLNNKDFFSVCNLADSEGIERSYALHSHEFFELELCTGGKGHQTLNGEKYDFCKGMIQLITTRDVHEVYYDPDFEHYNIRFNQENIDRKLVTQVFSCGENIVISLDEEDYNRILPLMQMSYDISKKYYCGKEYVLSGESIIKNIIEIIIMLLLDKMKAEKTESKKQSSYILKAIEYTEENFMNGLTAEKVAKYVGLNRNYFSSVFHENTGKTYKKYLTDVKLNYAQNLVCGTELSISEIAKRCGFGTLNSFIREFTAKYGKSPLKYRKILHGGR